MNLSNLLGGGGTGVEVGELCRLDPAYYNNSGGGSLLAIGSKYFLKNGLYIPYGWGTATSYNGDLQGVNYFTGWGANVLVGDMDGGLNGIVVLAQTNPILCYTTTDGFLSYTQRTIKTGVTNTINAIAYGNGRWVIVGTGGFSGFSTDGGVTWTTSTGMPFTARNVTWTGTYFVAVGTTSVAVSTDGYNWATQASGQFSLSYECGAVASDKNGKIMFLYRINDMTFRVLYSTNHGLNWTASNTDMYGNYYNPQSLEWNAAIGAWIYSGITISGASPSHFNYQYFTTDMANWTMKYQVGGYGNGWGSYQAAGFAINSSGMGTVLLWDKHLNLGALHWKSGTSYKTTSYSGQDGVWDNGLGQNNYALYRGFKLHKVDASTNRYILIPAPGLNWGGQYAGTGYPIYHFYNNIYLNDKLSFPKLVLNVKAPTFALNGGYVSEGGVDYYWRIK